MVHNQNITRLQVHFQLAHALPHGSVQWNQQLESLVPGQASGDRSLSKTEQGNRKRKGNGQSQFMPTLGIQQMCDAMRSEVQPASNSQQSLERRARL